ncbi:MAG: MarR family transcriptional regulator [Ruminococcus sp.]|nr:MarR family transcriptional regulator [Ruminococcus sp.]
MQEKKMPCEKLSRNLLEMQDPEPSMLINDISRLFHKTIHRDAGSENVSHGYRRMFAILCAQDGLTQQELARLAKLSPPSVSAALNKMEEDGLVERVHDTQDRRRVMVYITKQGRKKDQLVRGLFKSRDELLMKGITREERATLNELLKKLLRNLIEEDEE